MWFFFYPFTTQQDKALERHPLDRVTQFFANGNTNAKELELFSAEGWTAKCCAEKKNVSSIQRLGCGDTLHMTVVHFTWHPEEKHSPPLPKEPGRSQSGCFSTSQIILLGSCPFLSAMCCDLYFFPPVQNKHEMNMVGRLHLVWLTLFSQKKGILGNCLMCVSHSVLSDS